MAKPRKLLTPLDSATARRLPSEKEISETADMVAFVFERPEAGPLKKRFLEDAEAYRHWLRLQGDEDEGRVIAFLLQLILRCPQLLKRPPEFEWAMQELERLFVQRTVDPKKDEAFWKAMDLLRKGMRTGRPRNKALDFFRYGFITDLMNPPRQLEGLVVKFNKTQAVDQLAGAEQKLFDRVPDTRVIWRSHKRVKDFLRNISERIRVESSPSPTGTADIADGERATRVKKPPTGSNRRKLKGK